MMSVSDVLMQKTDMTVSDKLKIFFLEYAAAKFEKIKPKTH